MRMSRSPRASERAKHGDKRDPAHVRRRLVRLVPQAARSVQVRTEKWHRSSTMNIELVTIDLESPNAAPLLKTCKEALSKDELQKGVGYPFLAVLDADGKVITAQRTDDLEEGDHHDPKLVAAFLEKWKVPAKDAKHVLDQALARASSEDKRVFLAFGAPWCGWCHRASRLDGPAGNRGDPRPRLRDRAHRHRPHDRRQGRAKALPARQSSGGIPWFAILDAQGKALATSDGPGGNIGYPANRRRSPTS